MHPLFGLAQGKKLGYNAWKFNHFIAYQPSVDNLKKQQFYSMKFVFVGEKPTNTHYSCTVLN